MLAVRCLLFVDCCWLCVLLLLFVVVGCRVLFVVCCWLCVACHVSHVVVCCLMFIGWCLFVVDVCCCCCLRLSLRAVGCCAWVAVRVAVVCGLQVVCCLLHAVR